MRKLHEILGDVLKLAEIAEAGDLQAAETFAKELKVEGEEKIKSYYWLIQNTLGDIAEADVAIKTATEFKKRKEALVEYLEKKTMEALEIMGSKKIDKPDCRITLVEGRTILVRCPVDQLPVKFVTPKIEETLVADWKAVEAAVKSGGAVATCKMGTGKPFLKYPKLNTQEDK